MRYSVDNDRLLQSFLKLTSFDSESYGEREVGEYVTAELKKLGLHVRTDTTDAGFLERHPGSYPNIYAVLPGTGEKKDEEPLLLAAHLDTVSPGRGKRPRSTGTERSLRTGPRYSARMTRQVSPRSLRHSQARSKKTCHIPISRC